MIMNFERELDQFYTNKDIALQCYEILKGLLKEHNIKPSKWLEPSAGAGAFFSIIEDEKLGIDIDPKIEDVVKSDFLEYDLQNEEYITIGNPPFGKNASLAIKFFNKCALSSQVVAFIVPKTFKKGSVQNKLDKNMHLVFEWDVPVNSFNIKKEVVDVPCVFQVWIKKPELREKHEKAFVSVDFTFTDRHLANFAFQRVGAKAGAIKGPEVFANIADASHIFISAEQPEVSKILKIIDWSDIKFNTAGNPSISKAELIHGYSYYKANLIKVVDDYLFFNFDSVVSIIFLSDGNILNIKVDLDNITFNDALYTIQIGNVDLNLSKGVYLDFKSIFSEKIS